MSSEKGEWQGEVLPSERRHSGLLIKGLANNPGIYPAPLVIAAAVVL